MEYKVGNEVKIVSEKVGVNWDPCGKMKRRLGKIMTVREVNPHGYRMEEDKNENQGNGWFWYSYMIAGIADEPENIMPEVAALLKVEIGEEFEIRGNSFNPYKITKGGVADCNGDIIADRLNYLTTGEWEIIKKPWKPKDGEYIYYIDKDGKIYRKEFRDWFMYDLALFHSGNSFRTREEAETGREVIMEKFWS